MLKLEEQRRRQPTVNNETLKYRLRTEGATKEIENLFEKEIEEL